MSADRNNNILHFYCSDRNLSVLKCLNALIITKLFVTVITKTSEETYSYIDIWYFRITQFPLGWFLHFWLLLCYLNAPTQSFIILMLKTTQITNKKFLSFKFSFETLKHIFIQKFYHLTLTNSDFEFGVENWPKSSNDVLLYFRLALTKIWINLIINLKPR
jgi:hypothetical protein